MSRVEVAQRGLDKDSDITALKRSLRDTQLAWGGIMNIYLAGAKPFTQAEKNCEQYYFICINQNKLLSENK